MQEFIQMIFSIIKNLYTAPTHLDAFSKQNFSIVSSLIASVDLVVITS